MFGRVVSIINRYLVSVIETSFTCIALLLFDIFNPRSSTRSSKLSSQLPERYLDKVLIIRSKGINLLFDTWVVPNYQLTYLVFKAMVKDSLCCFVQIVTNAIITPLIETSSFIRKRLYTLLVFCRLKFCIALVVPLINAFKSFSINQKLMPISINTSTQIINPQVHCYSLIRIYRCFYFFIYLIRY